MDLKGKKILVTGGASFIGSHVVEGLLKKGANVRVVDDFSSGKKSNIEKYVKCGDVELIEGNLANPEIIKASLKGMEATIHLAAYHGGRGVVDTKNRECFKNFKLSADFIDSVVESGLEKIVFASSGCAYPNYLQSDTKEELYLREEDVGGGKRAQGNGYDPDNTYGGEKLSTEIMIYSAARAGIIKGASCRYFTVFGERGKEDHAIMAMIARAFIKQNPFEIWGTGEQVRNWTHVEDIARGTIRAMEKIDDGTAVNLGTTERTRVIDAARMVVEYVRKKYYNDYNPEFKMLPDKPTGPMNRVASNERANELLGSDWQRINFREGLHRTIDWYFKNKDQDKVKELFSAGKLAER